MGWVLAGASCFLFLSGLYIGYQMGRADTLEDWKDHEIAGKGGWEEEALYWRYKLFGKEDV